jgi:phosphate uptake regulator
MEIRKVQRTGGTTLIVSLPKKWTNSCKLKPGDSLSLSSLRDGSLLIRTTEARPSEKARELRIGSESPEYLFRRLIAIYMVGKGITNIRSTGRLTAKQRKAIRDFVHKVIGTEIVEETSNTVTIQDLIDTSELSIVKSLRRISLIVDSMFKDTMIALSNGDKDLAEDILLRDDDVDRLYWLICKQFHMLLNQPHLTAKMEIMPMEASFYRSSGKNLERIADHICRIAVNIKEMREFDASIISKITSISDVISKMLDGSVKALITKDFELANRTIDDMKGVVKSCSSLLSVIPKKKKSTVNLAYIVESIERIASYCTDIAEVAINMTAMPLQSSRDRGTATA